jgi:hypothetical protein
VFPNRGVPIGRTPLKYLGAPDIVDKNIDMFVILPYDFSETFYFVWYKMIYWDSNPYTA